MKMEVTQKNLQYGVLPFSLLPGQGKLKDTLTFSPKSYQCFQ